MTIARRKGVIANRAEIVALMKALEDVGVGKFVHGRSGHPSRFEWSTSLKSVGQAAVGEAVELEDIEGELEDDDQTEEEEVETVEHSFKLRPELDIALVLPEDLTVREAERLATFIRSLPFEE
jgi:hypothetical protein